jgi:uncharacterized protein YjbJ (UPF0337 family)
MSKESKSTGKRLEGKLEEAYGNLTGDRGHQFKGKAKQMQASAMKATEDLKEGANTIKKKLEDSVEKLGKDMT